MHHVRGRLAPTTAIEYPPPVSENGADARLKRHLGAIGLLNHDVGAAPPASDIPPDCPDVPTSRRESRGPHVREAQPRTIRLQCRVFGRFSDVRHLRERRATL